IPSSEVDWKEISYQFQRDWDFPNCLGALDGKHIKIQTPSNEGPLYFNYKGYHSIGLLAVANAKYEFIYAEVDASGQDSVDGVWTNSSLRKIFENGNANIPSRGIVPNSSCKLPFVLIGDDAFPLKSYLMKPFPNKSQSNTKRIFSYRLSRAQKVVENAFGILGSKFGILNKTIPFAPEKVKDIIMACVSLHNLLCRHATKAYLPPGYVDGERKDGSIIPGTWRQYDNIFLDMLPLERLKCNELSLEEMSIRDEFANYFMREGAIVKQKLMT
ncbi:unnamed protein product, partial [Meganyctiphanes norvegica]